MSLHSTPIWGVARSPIMCSKPFEILTKLYLIGDVDWPIKNGVFFPKVLFKNVVFFFSKRQPSGIHMNHDFSVPMLSSNGNLKQTAIKWNVQHVFEFDTNHEWICSNCAESSKNISYLIW